MESWLNIYGGEKPLQKGIPDEYVKFFDSARCTQKLHFLCGDGTATVEANGSLGKWLAANKEDVTWNEIFVQREISEGKKGLISFLCEHDLGDFFAFCVPMRSSDNIVGGAGFHHVREIAYGGTSPFFLTVLKDCFSFDPNEGDDLRVYVEGIMTFMKALHAKNQFLMLAGSQYATHFNPNGKLNASAIDAFQKKQLFITVEENPNWPLPLENDKENDKNKKALEIKIGETVVQRQLTQEEYAKLNTYQQAMYLNWFYLAFTIAGYETIDEETRREAVDKVMKHALTVVYAKNREGQVQQQVAKQTAVQAQNAGGASKYKKKSDTPKYAKTDKQLVTILGRKRSVYAGARGKQFVKVKGEFVALSDLKLKQQQQEKSKHSKKKK